MSAEGNSTILYVDDDATSRFSVSWLLRAAGYAVKEAANGQEALRLVEERPDLVILDVNLPDLSGFEVCRRIKSHPATTRIPVLHMSGVFVRSEDRTQGLEEGADAYLTKPAEPREMLATVKALLRVRQAEEAARSAARDWQATFDAISDAICLIDRDGRVRRCNKALAGLLGRPAGAILGRPCPPLFQEALGSPSLRPASGGAAEDARPGHEGEAAWDAFFARAKDARRRETWEVAVGPRCFLSTADPVLDESGEAAGGVYLFTDITEQKRIQAELTRLTEHLRLILESTGEGIFGLDPAGRCTFVNRAAAEMLGYDPAELVGRSMHSLIHHAHPDGTPYPEVDCPSTRTLRSGLPWRVDNEVLWRRDGTPFPVEYSSHPIHEGEALRGAVVTFADVTARRRLEEHLRQAQKMEAVGRLAGGIAHDFNNLLTVVTGNLSLVLAGMRAEHPDREALQAVDQAAWRAAGLVRQLLGFSRQSMLWLQPTNLNVCIDEILGILRRTIDPRIAVEVRAQPDLWPVRGDAGQINQVLMNLCLNARDAMPEGGRLVLETANVGLDEASARALLDAPPGEYVRLRASDTGHGIPAEVLPRIFEPYFTTKEPGRGTGLGLAVVFGIVKQHQGWILCSSAAGQGTTFEVYFTRLPTPEPVPPAPPPAPPPAGGRETILLVDDEPMLRQLGRAVLRQYGYEVLLADDGLQAVEVFRGGRTYIDLVLLDLTMPRLSGRETLRRLREIDPDVPVVFASGYSVELSAGANADDVQGFVRKPYREEDLAAAVRQALDRRRGERR